MDPLLLPVSKSLIQRDFGKPTVTERRALRGLRALRAKRVASSFWLPATWGNPWNSLNFLLTIQGLCFYFGELNKKFGNTMEYILIICLKVPVFAGTWTPANHLNVKTHPSHRIDAQIETTTISHDLNNKHEDVITNKGIYVRTHTHIYIYIHTYRWLIHLPNIAMNHLKNRAFARTKGNQPNLRTETRWFQSKATRP